MIFGTKDPRAVGECIDWEGEWEETIHLFRSCQRQLLVHRPWTRIHLHFFVVIQRQQAILRITKVDKAWIKFSKKQHTLVPKPLIVQEAIDKRWRPQSTHYRKIRSNQTYRYLRYFLQVGKINKKVDLQLVLAVRISTLLLSSFVPCFRLDKTITTTTTTTGKRNSK